MGEDSVCEEERLASGYQSPNRVSKVFTQRRTWPKSSMFKQIEECPHVSGASSSTGS
jgi:hypothetical protein